MPLLLECQDDDLSEAQIKFYERFKREQEQFTRIFEELAASRNAEIVTKGQYITVHQLSSVAGFQNTSTTLSQSTVSTTTPAIGLVKPASTATLLASPFNSVQNVLPSSNTGVILQGNVTATPIFADQNGTYQLLVIPKGPSQPGTNGVSALIPSTTVNQSNSTFTAANISSSSLIVTPKILSNLSVAKKSNTKSASFTSSNSISIKPKPTAISSSSPSSSIDSTCYLPTRLPAAKIPEESNATVVDLTEDETNHTPEVDSREISFARFNGKTYPSLMVVARPYLKSKISSSMSKEKNSFDAKVKSILTKSPTEFTEWLIQTGLIAAELICNVHVDANNVPVKMKLAMCSDYSKYPYSGGYVRFSDCCTQKFVSVFQSSIFENCPHPPTVLLKLIYHWSCHTPINNITSWIKVVDNLFVKNFYTNLRAVCTAAVHEYFGKIGGPQKKVQVGVISLGTTSVDGQVKKVKIEVLGILECETKNIRLRAVDPLLSTTSDKFLKMRLYHILKHLEPCVHKETIILTDNTIDKSVFAQLGYKNVVQKKLDAGNLEENNEVMEYLRVIVPRVFQNTLSLLNTRFIQQFLDELSWRECWGTLPSRAFDHIIAHIAEQTKIVSSLGGKLCNKLTDISNEPFKDWNYDCWKTNEPSDINKQKETALFEKQKPTGITKETRENEEPKSIENLSHNSLIPLENFYYGSLPPDNMVISKQRNIKLDIKCAICGQKYNNNIQLMEHLIDHALNEETLTGHRCRYCLKNFTSLERLNEHVTQDHEWSALSLRCLICEKQYTQRVELITHMHFRHKTLELPYHCVICKYRSSEHKNLVDHFYDVHNNGTRIQCPLCLKVIILGSNNIPSFFIGHIRKHHQKNQNLQCNKCILKFVKKNMLKEHLKKDHATINVPGVLRYPVSMMSIMMPRPRNLVTKTKTMLLVSPFTINKFEHTNRPLKPQSICLECSSVIYDTHHFGLYTSCMRCTYSTCCTNSIKKHIDTMHENKIQSTVELYEDKEVMYCTCGFQSSHPDACVEHLIKCNHKTLYINVEEARKCSLEDQSVHAPSSRSDNSEEDSVQLEKNNETIAANVINFEAEKAVNEIPISDQNEETEKRKNDSIVENEPDVSDSEIIQPQNNLEEEIKNNKEKESSVMQIDVPKSPDMLIDDENEESALDVEMETSEQNRSPLNEKMEVQEDIPEMDIDENEETIMAVDADVSCNTIHP